LLITADRGLCGAYNANLIRHTEAFLRSHAGRELSLSIVGRKGVDYFKRRKVELADRWVQIGGASVELAREIGAKLTSRFASGEADRIVIFYSSFRSALSQVPTTETLLPVTPPADAPAREYLMEPDTASLLDRLLPQYVEVRLYGALLEAVASEHGARMTAMDSATSNASEMIFSLTLQMNRARQAAITKELMEIVSGAEALRG
ncbi:MAG: ATP synthase F1 subunit gamma, partial [Candidatus Binatia bacterium]